MNVKFKDRNGDIRIVCRFLYLVECFKIYIVSIVSPVGGNRDHDPTNIV